jgi:hypothetical protein
MDKTRQRKHFASIFDSIDKEVYTEKTTLKSMFGLRKAIPIEITTEKPDRKTHLALLNKLLAESRRDVQANRLNPHQGLAIKDLIKSKKDLLAQKKFLESRKSVFKTQGTEYELVDMGNGEFSCVNKKEFRKLPNGKWQSKTRDPIVTFGSGAIADPYKVNESRLFPIDHFLGRRLNAYYMRGMCDVDFLPSRAPTDGKQQAEAELRNAADGAFLIRAGENGNEGYCTITYKIGGQVIHELFSEETGIMKSHESDSSPRTVFDVMNNLQLADSVQQRTIKRGVAPDHAGTYAGNRTARRPMRNDAASPIIVGDNGIYVSLPDFSPSTLNNARSESNASKIAHHRGAINAKNASFPKSLTIEEIEARKVIENYDLNYHKNGLALPYRRNNGIYYVLIRIKTSEGITRNFELPYSAKNKSVMLADGEMSIEKFLRSKGISVDGKISVLR